MSCKSEELNSVMDGVKCHYDSLLRHIGRAGVFGKGKHFGAEGVQEITDRIALRT